ncbi:MAG: acetate--CoA ligase family protein [Oscillospiraceae bacterium]|nr:acetate--CoA ligase family protein [Oscillospiraceae bacterium]
MNLLEHQAKELFSKYGLRLQKSAVLTDAEGATRLAETAGLSYPLVLKAQVPVGGRGKAGGIRITDGPQSLRDTVDAMFRSEIKGFAVKKLLMEEKAHIKEEWYLSILLDRDVKSPRIVFSTCGGVDIEETASNNPAAIVSLPINPMRGITDYAIQYIASKSGIDEGGRDAPNYLKTLKDVINCLYKMFMEYSCMLVEINPLCVDGRDGGLIALDGKVEIDDSALYRLPDVAAFRDELDTHPFVREARAHGFVYIPMENTGRVAAMSNGSGMLMSMVDLLSQSGATPACGLDLGGGAQKERISQAVRIALSAPSVDTLFVSIFGGITRCDEVAAGLKEALSNINRINEIGKTAIVRMEGTNRDKGIEILSETPGVVLVNSLIEGVEAVAGGHVS